MMRKIIIPRRKISTEWSSNLAYAVGLLATDGCVYSDGRHVNLTSKDSEQVLHLKMALRLGNRITKKARGTEKIKKYYLIQFGDVSFVQFLYSIGIGPAKSKKIKQVQVPSEFFFDFLRGCFDGDGTFYSYWDSRWKSSFMHYLAFASASRAFIDWMRVRIKELAGVSGHVTANKDKDFWQLRYAKEQGTLLIRKMYSSKDAMHLSRKRLKINRAFAMIGKSPV